ncbi:response regulator transcription factor [[Clostridium] spiroforme]|nr:response regulator transcription factor [Thomasclavelia spiroformis]
MKLLIIEDEKNMSELLKLELSHSGYDCHQAFDGKDGLEMALNDHYDLILLDLMLPRMNGIEVCRRLREHKDTPVIMLTARDSVMDKVNGLQIGADDYVAKPFDMEELIARIHALLRRTQMKKEMNTLEHGELHIDLPTRKVIYQHKEIVLTVTEFDLLMLLVKNAGQVLTRHQILDEVWGYDDDVSTNIIEVYIRYLRNKMKGIPIETVRGVGYRLV